MTGLVNDIMNGRPAVVKEEKQKSTFGPLNTPKGAGFDKVFGFKPNNFVGLVNILIDHVSYITVSRVPERMLTCINLYAVK